MAGIIPKIRLSKHFAFIITFLMISQMTMAQSKEESEVAKAVEELKALLVEPAQKGLEAISAKELSYGHSNGLVEDQKTFVESLMSKKYDFVTMDLTEQTIKIVGNAAIVRHILTAKTDDAGKGPGTANIKVLQVWQKQGNKWVLIARQAVKIVA
ncbi:nuclear transport factor 2 family protein [Dyadobacter sp. CY323]|uniref:nuclear transport factor 2 family protein n=1 Tax=Dyadobacter sp. CY323 TaxID=2907302 RepID=UPI001F384B8F|nr:nuclear transport factor 2 family protein [Dyadobacter sp. CY323]MCE6992149.1 nuclear transport factor 2 family protein [Dyadobacter sp. CY323]